MAAADRRTGDGLAERLFREPGRFDFFQAVRLLERLAAEEGARDPQGRRHPVGGDRPPAREAVRFGALPALSFPAADVAKLTAGADGLPPELVTAFIGLTGPNGVLPQHYTALMVARARLKDHALRDFLDLFHHRLVSHFYRAWEKQHLPAAWERSKRDGGEDAATRGLYALAGFGTGGLRGRMAVADETLAFYAGPLAHHPRNAAGLEALLTEYFGVPAAVEQLHGQWLYLDRDNQALLPPAGGERGQNVQLGVDAVVGRRVWDVQSKFRLRLGPLTEVQFRRFRPDGDALVPLGQLTRAYAGPELDFDVQPVLKPREAPDCRLEHDEAGGSRLGWDAWLRTHEFGAPVGDAVFGEPAPRPPSPPLRGE